MGVWGNSILLVVGTLLVSGSLLEVLQKIRTCKSNQHTVEHERRVAQMVCADNPTSPFAQEALVRLRQKREHKEDISKDEYKRAAEQLIAEVDPATLGRMNGIACGDFGFVRRDLSPASKLVVRRHELEHLLQTGQGKNQEFAANVAAAREYPFASIKTIFVIMGKRWKTSETLPCYLVSLWRTFKRYFLPW